MANGFGLTPQEDVNTDIILQSPLLTEEDRIFAQNVAEANQAKFEKEMKSDSLASIIREEEFVAKVESAIKAILQHKIIQRQEGR